MQPESRAGHIVAAVVAVCVVITSTVWMVTTRSDPIAAAFDELQGTESFRFAITQEIVGGDTTIASPLVGMEGIVDLTTGRVRLTMSLPIGETRVDCVTLASEEEVFVGVHPSRRASMGASWVRTDAAALTGAAGFPGTFDTALGRRTRGFGDVENGGAETIRGIATTRYRATLDIDDLIGEDGTGFGSFEDDVPVDAYVGHDGLVHRFVAHFTLTRPVRSTFATATDYTDFGVDVDIDFPSGDAVAEVDGGPERAAIACLPSDLGV